MPIGVSRFHLLKEEKRSFKLNGTIIDIETIGDFQDRPSAADNEDYLARVQDLRIIAVGTLDAHGIRIIVANGTKSLTRFQAMATNAMSAAVHPLYAFNKSFEESCYFWNSGMRMLDIEYELQERRYEKKEDVVGQLGISQYDDPYHGIGRRCIDAFESADLHNIVAHNRACLLKEYDIYRKRGSKEFKTKWLDLESIRRQAHRTKR